MKNLVVLLALAGSVVACETHGLIESSYVRADGSRVSLQQFNQESGFYYSVSASPPSRACSARALKVVAMGADGHVRVRLERAAPGPDCES